MAAKTNNDKYLILRTEGCISGGLDHMLMVLKGAIKEAVSLDRILVINKFAMAPKHNLEHKLENLEFKQYIDLDKTQIYKTRDDRSIQQINSNFHYIEAGKFNLAQYSKEQVLLIDKNIDPITEKQNNQHKVIIRKTAVTYYYLRTYLNIEVSFYPSDEVNRLTDIVMKAMGTCLTNVKKKTGCLPKC